MKSDSTTPWSKAHDEQFRQMVDARVSPEAIACALRKSTKQLQRRAYDLGLPLKWFKNRPCHRQP